MQISNNYQAMSQYQLQSSNKPDFTIQPIREEDPKYSNKEIYEASQGNLIRDNDGEIAITPQGETNINNAQEAEAAEAAAEVQAQRDSQREVATDVIATQSKKSQVEIYLAVATEGNINDAENDTAQIIESLRDIQKQNNVVEAFATYKDNQSNPVRSLLG